MDHFAVGADSRRRDNARSINARSPDADSECAEALARLSAQERNGVEALIQSAKKRDPDEPSCRLAAGEWRASRGQYDMAETEFREAVAFDPNDPMLLRKWAGALSALGQNESARGKETLANDLERRNREWRLSTR